jgi:hypothetical protein
MARVQINVELAGGGNYEVTLDRAELNKEAWGSDKSHVDALVDEAVTRIKRAYNNAEADRG